MDNQMNQNGSNELRADSVSNEKKEGASLEKETRRHSHHSHHGERHHGSSHHHHHHSSHHRHHSSGNKKKKRNVNKKLMWAISISVFVLLVGLVVLVETMNVDRYRGEEQVAPANDVLSIEMINEDGVLVKDAVYKYLLTDLLNSYNATVRPSDFSIAADGRLDEQVPVALKLSTKDGIATSYKIELADNADFVNATVDYVYKSSATYEFEHLYANTSYFYRVTAYTNKGNAVQTGSFKTADTPRILSIDGLSNVRDIGNWRTDSGVRIKQGLLIRGTEMDGAVESGYHLTNDGLMDMLNVFGIKTDIDLRAQTLTSMDALGSRVAHKYYDMVMYDGIFTDYGKEKIRMVFADLANPDNYPIYLHCTYGCDRTGTICYLLEALLGVSRGDCLKDYGLSNLNIANIQVVENGLKAYEGNTLKEQVESYLLSCGVSEYQISSIRNIFLGD